MAPPNNNNAMKEVSPGVFAMWGGNANGMTTAGAPAVRITGGSTINEYLFLVNTTLGGNPTTILNNVYHPADMNLDASVRATGPLTQNDYLFLLSTTLGGNVSNIISNVYHTADVNLDGQVRASGPLAQNDYLFLLTSVLGGNAGLILTQHQ